MCLIIDTNRFGVILGDACHQDYGPILEWLYRGSGIVVFGGTKYGGEIGRNQNARRFFKELYKAGKAILHDSTRVDEEEQRIKDLNICSSDDEHIIALARISGARVVCTEDQNLWKDINSSTIINNPRGKIYRDPSHLHLLKHYPSCRGIAPKKSRTKK